MEIARKPIVTRNLPTIDTSPKKTSRAAADTSRSKSATTARRAPSTKAVKVNNKEKKSSLPAIATANPPTPLTVRQQALQLLALPPQHSPSISESESSSCGHVKVKFNHYNKPFPIHNGVLKWEDVDAEYCFSFVYRGSYSRDIFVFSLPSSSSSSSSSTSSTGPPLVKDEAGDFFLGLSTACNYMVVVEEDPNFGIGAEGLRISDKPLTTSSLAAVSTCSSATSTKGTKGCTAAVNSGNAATKLLTNELLSMDAMALQSQAAKDIIERRDIEDVLFSGAS